ncbi:MAG: DNA translocase FtsK [Rhodothermaceae bacterium]|nr:DNA translocase FtsK [Rhodothermaceae bacterium]MYC05319.1 DNA translocase FtsK [Rhodothermaceae bacterium]MYI18340.1 DNA translocase FtsK [Rhodothermaceae bacterium]
MTRNELIASVALNYVKEQLKNEPQGTLRICMLGFGAAVVREIARAALNDPDTRALMVIKINTEFDPDGELPQDLRSDESITHWRHCPLTNGKRAVLFAATHEELQRNNKSVEKITKLEPDSLRTLNKFWTNQAGLTQSHLDETKLNHLQAALDAANRTNAARTIEYFAGFMLRIADAIINKGRPLQKAVDYALPALCLPRESGQFECIAENKRNTPSEWAKIFRRLLIKVRPHLYRLNSRGEPIDKRLEENFEAVKDRLTDSEKEIISAFLESTDISPDGWTSSQNDLVNLSWQSIKEVFEGIEKADRQHLGTRTINFFIDEFDDPLNDDLKNLLGSAFPKDPPSELRFFFEDNQERLSRDGRLYGSWEKYIYSNPKQFDNFFVGFVATLHRLYERVGNEEISENRVVVRIPRSREKSFWRDKNSKIVRYFAVRYRGIQELFGPDVTFDFGKLYEFFFPHLDGDLTKKYSRSQNARSLKFEVELDPEGVQAKLMFIWQMPVDALATSMANDLVRIANEQEGNGVLLPTAEITRQPISAKGQIQRIDLTDVNTIRDVHYRNEGIMVAPNSAMGDSTEAFFNALDNLSAYLSTDGIDEIRIAFSKFKQSYESAIRDWAGGQGKGIVSEIFLTQAEEFGELLNTLDKHANNDLARESLWKECMCIGVANISSGAPAAIILPWHPFRMAEVHIKAKQVVKIVNAILRADNEDIFRADLLFQQKQEELLSDYYPEVCIGFDNDKPILLSITSSKFDYSLAEPPQHKKNVALDNVPDNISDAAARAFSDIGEQFLKLLPHEQNNFSVVLYNSESDALPNALVKELSKKVQEESDLQCDLLLTHSDLQRMRTIYEQQNVAVGDDSGSIMASEAARNFLSRLRVGFLNANDLSDRDSTRISDLVALQDVVATNAQVVWKKAPLEEFVDFLEHVPSRWSRRRPVSALDTSASVYLTAPKQPQAGQVYLNAIQTLIHGENAQSGDVIPAREVNFSDGQVRDVFKEAHKIGEWVVNYDELVDRRLLDRNGIQIIRHIQDRTVNRNITVSTTSGQRLLQTLLIKRLNRIDPNIVAITNRDGKTPIEKLIKDATELSGHVVMRAARYGHYANELIGIVLSMEMIKSGIGGRSLPIGWYFLDDYASWFGQREEQIADIMAIAPRIQDGKHVLRIAISEAKFVGSNGYKGHARKSAKQLEETISRLRRALDPNRHRLDRDSWLHRIGDFMINGMKEFDGVQFEGWNLHKWSDEVRQGNVQIILAGFSHVFVHDSDEYVNVVELEPLSRMPHCYQQIYDRPRVAAALRSFAAGPGASEETSTKTQRVWKEALTSSFPNKESAETAKTKHAPKGETSDEIPDTTSDPDQTPPHQPAPPNPETSLSRSKLPVEVSAWLGKGDNPRNDEVEKWKEDTVRVLQRALRDYDLTAEVMGSRLTPNAVRVRFRGSNDMTVKKVERHREELLTSHAIQVIDVIPAAKEVIIMVAREQRAILHLKDVWRQRELPNSAPETNSSLLLGAHEEDGNFLYLNVGRGFAGLNPHGPHTLIAGETGSGKGVLVQCLLLDICATNSPDNARIRMIDPKAGIDFAWLRRMPHLDGELITTRDRAVEALEELVEEMERRNRLLAGAGVSKLSKYNEKVTPPERLPRIWLFHDELADWMLIPEYRDAVELNVSRLGVKSRAAGINLVLITQRPDKDAMPMQLRANLTNRLVLKVADKRNSVLALDEPGAERLLGRGHLAAKLSGEPKIMLTQVPFADEDEISELAALIVDAWQDESPDSSN